MVEWFKAAVLKTAEAQASGSSNLPLSASFLPSSDSINQSQFAQPPLKPVDTKAFTNHIAVCLKHTQTAKSERFYPIFGPLESEF